jgi:hypothetical protein
MQRGVIARQARQQGSDLGSIVGAQGRHDGAPDLGMRVEPRSFHPNFGTEIETARLEWNWQGELPFRIETRFEGI